MSSVIITPGTRKQFDSAFNLLSEFGSRQKRLSLDDEEDFNFAFLKKEKEGVNEAGKEVSKKLI
jgi:hypothetical protein